MGRKKEKKPSKSSIKRTKAAEQTALVNASLQHNDSSSITNGQCCVDNDDDDDHHDESIVNHVDIVNDIVDTKDVKKINAKSKGMIAGIPAKIVAVASSKPIAVKVCE